MSLTVFLDAGPLGMITNPKKSPATTVIVQWAFDLEAAGHWLIVPAMADYEVRRELVRAEKAEGTACLNAFNSAVPGRFLSVTDEALLIGADLWARARNTGTTTADPKELNADVLIAGQALATGLPPSEFIIATLNVGHLALFVPAELWSKIQP